MTRTFRPPRATRVELSGLCAALLLCAACSKKDVTTAADGGGPVAAQRQALVGDGYPYGEIFRVSHIASGAANLSDFQLQVKLNTATEISAGRMRSDCADIRVYAGNGCTAGTPVNFWVADGTCNTANTSIWLGLPSVLAGSVTSFAIYWGDPNATSASNGAAVFPIFFDDFNDGSLDTNKWNIHAPQKLTESGGKVTTSGGATAIWTKQKVMAQGQTVFGVGTNAQSAGGADIEYGAATMTAPFGPGDIHFTKRTYTGATYMSWDNTIALIGRGSSMGSCGEYGTVGRWANAPGDNTWFQTEFFYEWVANDQTKFGIYDKFGVKQQVTLGGASCKTPATESAYYQWDHADNVPNPVSSLDYAYVRKYANPDPLITYRTTLALTQCLPNGTGPCTPATASAACASGACSSHASVCIPPLAGACYVDADCGNGQFCDRAAMACTTKLPLGTQLPADGLHDTCSVSNTNAACDSGLCNVTTSTCAAVNGTSCEVAAECVVNVCDTDGKCGFASGGSCSENNVSVCRASCGQSGVCLPPNGCDRDTGCDAGQHCDLQTLGCVADLSNGAAIPADHGSCGGSAGSAGNTLDVCVSGQCNELTNTCAAANGGACSTAAECESNVCGADAKCGHVNGAGPCDYATRMTVCRSQSCSLNGIVCIPDAAGSCWVDADCDGDQFCHRDTFTCTAKLALGAALPLDDLHEGCTASINAACQSGLCNADTLTCARENGGSCTTASECVTNVCGDDGVCGYANGSGNCAYGEAAPQCRSGLCSNVNVCIPSGGCAADSDCASGTYCVVGDLQCAPALANGFPLPDGHGTCAEPGPAGSALTACASGSCNPHSNTCAGANTDTSCTYASECVLNHCGANGQCGRADGENGCTSDNAAEVCQSGACSLSSVCIPAGNGRCWSDADCAGDNYCHRTTFLCTAPLPAGSQLPGDDLHNACPPDESNDACASGKCNRVTKTCAQDFLSSCTSASECVSNVCDSDGKCGYANGNGPCMTDTQESVCRSGVCNSTGRCIPPSGCGHDSDCPSESFCRADFSCASLLANGSALPDGRAGCGESNAFGAAKAACASGSCNPDTNTCAGANINTSCASASECVGNICGTNGKCGRADGEAGCSDENAADVCQSGSCSASSNVCIPAGEARCWADSDCGSDSYCHRATFVCTTQLSPGSPLPGDDLHDACPVSELSAACATGTCNRATGTCAVGFLSSCTSASECVSNVCDADSKCGYADGNGPCTEETASSVCRSGTCNSTGRCIPAQGCGHDSECPSDRFCRADFSCALLLDNGAALPDGRAACGDSNAFGDATAACASGSCNPDTNTCAGANTDTSCDSAGECVVNICGANGQCGRADGEAGCSDEDAGEVCQSGNCSVSSNVCVPAGEARCWTDAECGSDKYCHRATFTCSDRLPAGSPLPGDDLHDACPLSEVSFACASGTCNRAANTCAVDLLGSCTGANECVSNVCDSDGKCGYANGNGPCTTDTQESVCRSGLCNSTGRCIPAGGCGHDNDCPADRFCRAADFSCALDLANGRSLADGRAACGSSNSFGDARAACASGSCNPTTNTCAGPNIETQCDAATECVNNVCGANGRCGHANGAASSCTRENASVLCQSGACSEHGARCVPQGADKCWVDQDCANGQYCHRATLSCEVALDSGATLPDDGLHARCRSDGTSRACATGHCDPATQRCVALNGAVCSANEACLAQVCGANGRCGYAVGEGPCVADKAETLCQSGVCAQSGVCIASGELRCWVNADCDEGSYCDRAEQTCRERIAPGAPVPNDGLHMGCSDGASEACSTGLCSSDTGLCVAANNITCESAHACFSGLCGGNGKCGLADGEGPCSEANAAESCQSGKCSPSGDVCMSGDCWFDADCASAEYCERSAQRCAPKLRAGASLPDDDVHDSCEDGRSDACSSGHCTDGRCVEPTIAAGLSGGGGCSAADATPGNDASVSLVLLALFLLERRRRRPSTPAHPMN